MIGFITLTFMRLLLSVLLFQTISLADQIMSPQPGGWGDILFLARIPSVLALASAFISMQYLLLGGGESLIRTW